MWLGLGHLSAKKALCLGISFQKQVVNPDVTFHVEQNKIKNLLLPLSHVHTKENGGFAQDLPAIWILVHANKKTVNFQFSFPDHFLVSINFPWEHKGEYDKEYTLCGYCSQQQNLQLFCNL